MAAIHVDLEHIAVGCNRVVHALHWGDSGLLAYGGHNAVVVYDPEEARVLGTLLGHTDVVTCVRWLPPAAFGEAAPPAALASGSGDCTVRVWVWTPHTPHQPWRLAATLQAHSAPITSLTTLALPGGGLLLASTAGDGDVAVWECSAAGTAGGGRADDAVAQPSWHLRQRISLVHQIQHCAALSELPGEPGWLLLALGGVDGVVRLFCAPPGGQFEAVCRLAGHQDWVRGLDFALLDGGKLLLASASQDRNIRVWAVQQQQQQQQQQDPDGGGGDVAAAPAPPLRAPSLTRYAPKPLIRAGQHSYAATLEALLVGHEDWVHSVAWHPRVPAPSGGGATRQPACLLSASMDRTMVLWRPDAATGLWMSEESVGDAGANHLGYYTGVFAPRGDGIAAHGFTGALHVWRRGGDGGWAPRHSLGGHFAPVVDACWAADGGCLLTVSSDQTARITTRLADGHWCEIARPQVHGHDFSAVAALPCAAPATRDGDAPERSGGDGPGTPAPRYLYASGSEEKVVRVFEAPRAFLHTLASARGTPVSSSAAAAAAALGAALPALGLSNKAVYQQDEEGEAAAAGSGSGGLAGVGAEAYAGGPDLAPNAAPSAVAGPPLEEHLAQNTLWPEVHKLYGHGNELYCLAADPRGAYLASACRAQAGDAAAVWLWDTRTWTAVAQLAAHTLTVTQLAFSPDGRLLASASRDRSVALFARQPAGAPQPFRLLGRLRAHSRIVWGLHWSPDSALLATASRDGKVKVWDVGVAAMAGSDGSGGAALPSAPAATIECGDSVRSVQFAPARQPDGSHLLAAGLEGGSVQLLRLAAAGAGAEGRPACELLWASAVYERHAAAVRRLCWWRDEEGRQHLASCSDDHALRLYAVAPAS